MTVKHFKHLEILKHTLNYSQIIHHNWNHETYRKQRQQTLLPNTDGGPSGTLRACPESPWTVASRTHVALQPVRPSPEALLMPFSQRGMLFLTASLSLEWEPRARAFWLHSGAALLSLAAVTATVPVHDLYDRQLRPVSMSTGAPWRWGQSACLPVSVGPAQCPAKDVAGGIVRDGNGGWGNSSLLFPFADRLRVPAGPSPSSWVAPEACLGKAPHGGHRPGSGAGGAEKNVNEWSMRCKTRKRDNTESKESRRKELMK